jgi:hypothetical protein
MLTTHHGQRNGTQDADRLFVSNVLSRGVGAGMVEEEIALPSCWHSITQIVVARKEIGIFGFVACHDVVCVKNGRVTKKWERSHSGFG